MATIDIFTFRSFRGRLRPARRVVGLLPTPSGANGHAIVLGGWKAQVHTIRTSAIISGDSERATNVGEEYRATIGDAVPVFDQFGRWWSAVRVMDVTYEVFDTPIPSETRLNATWQLLPASAAPA